MKIKLIGTLLFTWFMYDGSNFETWQMILGVVVIYSFFAFLINAILSLGIFGIMIDVGYFFAINWLDSNCFFDPWGWVLGGTACVIGLLTDIIAGVRFFKLITQ